MVFKDEAKALVSRWQNIRNVDEVDALAVQTVIAISAEHDVPAYVFDALDGLLLSYDQRARRIADVVRYLHSLADDRSIRAAVTKPDDRKPE